MSGTAPVTRILVGLNVAVFLVIAYALNGQGNSLVSQNFFERWGLVAEDFWNGGDWKPWQPLTSMFLHGSIIHLFVNMFGVWSLGIALERTIGSARFLALYIISGLAGALTVILFQDAPADAAHPGVTVGASGALLGLLGAIAIFFPKSELLVFFIPMKARTAALAFGLISLFLAVFKIVPSISHWGHLGGLVGGLLYSKFALRLSVTQHTGSDEPANDFFARRIRKRREEEDVINFLNDFFRGGQEPPRREKIINPQATETEPPERPRSGPPMTPDEPTGGRRLYFDPATGRFFFR